MILNTDIPMAFQKTSSGEELRLLTNMKVDGMKMVEVCRLMML